MCVIIHKDAGVNVPSEEIFFKCFARNDHGAGILLHRNNSKILEIHKGMMTFDEFKKVNYELNIKKEDTVVYHFKITTTGETLPEYCHPFPISNKIEDLFTTRINCKRGFAHNGTFGKGDEERKLSDTQLFIEKFLSKKEIQDNLDSKEVDKLLDKKSKENRFIVADAEKCIFKRYGEWYELDKLFYSNDLWEDTYRNLNKTRYYYGNNNGYDFYFDELYPGYYSNCKK